ncbi:hypothetical protein JCM1841_005368 [Sporobolomyces salmonicolor]
MTELYDVVRNECVQSRYFAYTQSLCLTFAAIAAGFFQLYFHRTKWLLVCGLLVRLLGIGLMIKPRGAHGSTFFIVITQVLQGMGGGIASASSQLLAQDVATITAFVLLLAEIGNAIGIAIATSFPKRTSPPSSDARNEHLSIGTGIRISKTFRYPAGVADVM